MVAFPLMLHKKNNGIVLKTYFPYKKKIVILDRTGGKFAAIPAHTNIGVGMMIAYTITPSGGNALPFLIDMEIIISPVICLYYNMLFFCHVLELCFYFIPDGPCDQFVFDLLYSLYNFVQYNEEKNPHYTSLVLFKLLSELGLYQEDVRSDAWHYYKFTQGLVTVEHLNEIDDQIESSLNKLIYTSLSHHHCFNNLKTVHFLTIGRDI